MEQVSNKEEIVGTATEPVKAKSSPIAESFSNAEIAAKTGLRVRWNRTKADELAELQGTTRTDYGQTVDITIPRGYHKQVDRAWEMYASDRLFASLIDRVVDYSANGSEWELSMGSGKKSFFQRLLKKADPEVAKMEKQKLVWEKWAEKVNEGVDNILPGLEEVHKWVEKHLQLSGMVTLDWEWGDMEINGKTYQMPTNFTVHNASTVLLKRKNSRFVEEETLLKIDKQEKAILESNKDVNKVRYETEDVNGLPFLKLPKDESFTIKYRYSPGDWVALRPGGKNMEVGQGLYPSVPYVQLYDSVLLRRALKAADLSILDGIINYIIDWEIGDDTVIKDASGGDRMPNQPKAEIKDADGTVTQQSTLDRVKEIITSETRGNLMEIFKPYYVKMKIIMPDTTVLLNHDKYIQPTLEILEGFGILFPPVNSRMDLTETNRQNFESMVEMLRQNHWKKFVIGILVPKIMKRNPGLDIPPNYVMNVLNTKTKEFREDMHKLARMGKISTESLHQAHDLDSKVETARIAKEVKGGAKKLYDENVPVTFVQKTEDGDNKTKESKTSGNALDKGRPKKGEESTEE